MTNKKKVRFFHKVAQIRLKESKETMKKMTWTVMKSGTYEVNMTHEDRNHLDKRLFMNVIVLVVEDHK